MEVRKKRERLNQVLYRVRQLKGQKARQLNFILSIVRRKREREREKVSELR